MITNNNNNQIMLTENPLTDKLNNFKQNKASCYFNNKTYILNQITIGNLLEGCSICQNSFLSDQKITILECDHVFHHDCITRWKTNNNTCPADRKQLEFLIVGLLKDIIKNSNSLVFYKKILPHKKISQAVIIIDDISNERVNDNTVLPSKGCAKYSCKYIYSIFILFVVIPILYYLTTQDILKL